MDPGFPMEGTLTVMEVPTLYFCQIFLKNPVKLKKEIGPLGSGDRPSPEFADECVGKYTF